MFIEDYLPLALFIIVAVLFRAVFNRINRTIWMKEKMLAGKIVSEVGEIETRPRVGSSRLIAVQKIKPAKEVEEKVGIEFGRKGPLSEQMDQIALSKEEAISLIRLLEKAVNRGT